MTYMAGPVCYESMDAVVEDEGNQISYTEERSLEACQKKCGGYDGCGSFTFCTRVEDPTNNACYLKDKTLNGSEPTKGGFYNCASYYKSTSCGIVDIAKYVMEFH